MLCIICCRRFRKRVSKGSCLFRKFSTEGIVEFDCRNTRTALANTSIESPPLNSMLLDLCPSYLVERKFFMLPQNRQLVEKRLVSLVSKIKFCIPVAARHVMSFSRKVSLM